MRYMTADEVQDHMDRFIARHPYSSRYFGGPMHSFNPKAKSRHMRLQYRRWHKHSRAAYRRRKKGLA